MSIIIGADIGTSNIKVIAFESNNEIRLSESAPCETLQPSSEIMEQNPRHILEIVNALLVKVLKQLPLRRVSGICFSTAMHSIMAVDEQNEPLTNAILWGDTRSEPQTQTLRESGLAEQLYHSTGVPVHPSLPVCKILWLKENQPGVFHRAVKFISLKEYFFYEWFGKYRVDYSIAGASGMLDIHRLGWSQMALQIAGIQENRLSEIVPATHIENKLTSKYGALFGTGDIPFIIGSSDGCLANIGSGVINERQAALTIGTSGAIRTTLPSLSLNERPTLFCYPLLRDVFIKGGAINNGGSALQWFAQGFIKGEAPSEDPFSLAIQQAESVSAGSGGVIFLPYLLGERAPVWDAKARGVFFGIHSQHDRSHFSRAVLEGIGLAMYDVFGELNKSGGKIETLVASGGFVRSSFWVQMISDIFGREVVVSNLSDASATGAAILGRYAIGSTPKLEVLSPAEGEVRVFYPDKENHEIYMSRFKIFKSLYISLKGEFNKLEE